MSFENALHMGDSFVELHDLKVGTLPIECCLEHPKHGLLGSLQITPLIVDLSFHQGLVSELVFDPDYKVACFVGS